MFNLNLVSLNPLCFRAAFVWKENPVRRWLNMLSDCFCPLAMWELGNVSL